MIVQLEWGADGLKALGADADVIVVVDVLSFSTCVDVAIGCGATVYPYPWRDESAATFAAGHEAHLATPRGGGEYSLSPASLQTLPPSSRLVLPSPNGSTLSLAAREHGVVLAGCLRNANAVAEACASIGGTIALIPAGERWPTGRLRPALEDVLGAGAIASHFDSASLSADARAAVAAFDEAQPELRSRLLQCASGQELSAIGFEEDVELASRLNVSRAVPMLQGGAFRQARNAVAETGLRVELKAVGPSDRPILVRLLDEYLQELSHHRERQVGPTKASEYRYLDAYFGEPGRHAFFIVVDGELAGFALMRGPDSTERGWQVAEFFVRPHHRRSGTGRRAISTIWGRFPGIWELHVHARNEAAIAFWDACVRKHGCEEPIITSLEADDGWRVSYRFEVDG